MSVSLGRLVKINPLTPEFDHLKRDEPITFMPLEACWPDARVDLSRRAQYAQVAFGYTRFRRGDVLMPKITPTFEAGRVFVIASDTSVGAGTTELHVLRSMPGVDSRFIAYVCRSQPFLQEGGKSLQGVGNLRRVPVDFIRLFQVSVQEEVVQRAIADYLDRETAKIDSLIGKQKQLIDTLRERRVAVVEQELLGLEWRVPLRSVTRLIQTGPFGSQLKSNEYVEGGVPVINPSHMVAGQVVPDAMISVGEAKSLELERHLMKPGDVVVARRGELGRCAVVVRGDQPALCGTGSAVIRPLGNRLEPRFLALIYGSQRIRDSLSLASVGSTMDNLNAGIIGSLRIPLPSSSAQIELLDHLDEETAKIDLLISKAERFIELAKERRSALITAAVTGQIDVRDEQNAKTRERTGMESV